MKLIVDVNVILSALIRDSATRKIILESGQDLYFPEPSLRKIIKYKPLIMEKSGMTEKALFGILARLFTRIKLMPAEGMMEKWSNARGIMGHIDEEDVVFIAAALSIDGSAIWSDDADFERQDKIKVVKTKDMIRMFPD